MLQERIFWGQKKNRDIVSPMAHYVYLGLSNVSTVQSPECLYKFTSIAMTRTYTRMVKTGTIAKSAHFCFRPSSSA